MAGIGKQHATSLDADQTCNPHEDKAGSHSGITYGPEKKKTQADKKEKVSKYPVRPMTLGGQSTHQQQKKHQCKVCGKCF